MRLRLGDSNRSLSRGPRRPHLPNLGNSPFSAAQKIALDARARCLDKAPSYINPGLSLYNPPADANPFTITPPNGFPVYPGVGQGPITVITLQVNFGLLAVIRFLAITHFGGNPPDGTGIVVWRVLRNGSGIRGLNALTAQYGTMAAPKSVVLLGWENDIITVTAECPALLPNGGANPGPPGGSTTAASFDGFTYPISEAVGQDGD